MNGIIVITNGSAERDASFVFLLKVFFLELIAFSSFSGMKFMALIFCTFSDNLLSKIVGPQQKPITWESRL